MTWQQFTLDATPYVADAAFFAGLLFVLTYSLLANWWKTPIGITIVALDLMIDVVLLPGILLDVFGINVAGSETWTLIVLGAIAAVPLIILWRLYILLRLQFARSESTGDG